MRTRFTIQLAAAAVGLVAATTCTESTAPAKTGFATLSLVTPNTNDGAILVALTGPGVSDIKPASTAYAVYWRVVSPSEAQLIVVGDLAAGVMATASLAEGTRLDAYHAQVVEAATRNDEVQPSTVGYSVTLAAAP